MNPVFRQLGYILVHKISSLIDLHHELFLALWFTSCAMVYGVIPPLYQIRYIMAFYMVLVSFIKRNHQEFVVSLHFSSFLKQQSEKIMKFFGLLLGGKFPWFWGSISQPAGWIGRGDRCSPRHFWRSLLPWTKILAERPESHLVEIKAPIVVEKTARFRDL